MLKAILCLREILVAPRAVARHVSRASSGRGRLTEHIATESSGPSEPPRTAPPSATRTLRRRARTRHCVDRRRSLDGADRDVDFDADRRAPADAQRLRPGRHGEYLPGTRHAVERARHRGDHRIKFVPDRRTSHAVHTLSLLFGVTGFAISCVVSLPLSWFFGEPQLPPVVIALSLAFVITALRTVPYALLRGSSGSSFSRSRTEPGAAQCARHDRVRGARVAVLDARPRDAVERGTLHGSGGFRSAAAFRVATASVGETRGRVQRLCAG